jgi:ribosomal protein L5
MVFFKTYSQKIIKHDLINVFAYPNLNELPELKKIILNFGYQKSNLKHIISGLLALEFLSS